MCTFFYVNGSKDLLKNVNKKWRWRNVFYISFNSRMAIVLEWQKIGYTEPSLSSIID